MRSLVFTLLFTTAALAQPAPPAAPRDGDQPPPSLNDLLPDAGGSLLQAGLAQQGADGSLASGSFFAVPPQKPKVVRKHDLVTIVIREQSEFASDGQTSLSKDANLQAELNDFIRFSFAEFAIKNAIGDTKPRIDLTGSRSFDGQGSIERTDSFTARITAEVVDVKPNGNLVLAARKRIVTDEDEQLFLIAGIARAADILPDNTVLSTQLFDLDLRRMNKGAVMKATQRGALPKLLDAINPW